MAYISQIGENKFQAYFYLGKDPNAKPIRRSRCIEASSLKAAERKANKLEAELKQQAHTPEVASPSLPSKSTFNDLVANWREIKAPSLAVTTFNRYCQILEKVLLPSFGSFALKDITPLMIETFLSDQKKTGISDRTLKNYYDLLSTLLNQGVRWSLLKSNPCLNVSKPKYVPSQNISFYDDQELKKLFAAIEQEQASLEDQISTSRKYKYKYTPEQASISIAARRLSDLMFKVFIYISVIGGTRLSETMGLEFKDFNFDENTMLIQRTSHYNPSNKIYSKDTLKNGSSSRQVYMPIEIMELVALLKEAQEKYKSLLGTGFTDSDRLFIMTSGEVGSPMNPDTMKAAFKRFIEKHNLKKIRLHDLRHSCASFLLNKGMDIPTVAERLGHKDVRVTTQIYNHIYKGNKKASAEAFRSLF